MLKVFLSLSFAFFTSACSTPAKVSPDLHIGIRETISKHLNELRTCYEQGLTKQKDLKGKVVVEFEMNDFGKVIRVHTDPTKSTLFNEDLNRCIYSVFDRMQFPRLKLDQNLTVYFPFFFDDKKPNKENDQI
jgi:hypothetical protein